MPTGTVFDYYYGDESNQFSFYRIPRQLITGDGFKKLSTDAKLLYGLLLDRMGLSAKNGWYDELGRVYIYYTLDEIQEDLNCGHDKATKLLVELDSLACLIFSAFASTSTPTLDTSLSAVTMSWQYVAETIFNMLVLVGLVKGAERIIKEMLGL